MKLYDYHVHSMFSADSKELPENYIKAAREKGVAEICFTDHIDLHYPGPLQFELDAKAQYETLRSFDGSGGVSVKVGVEFGLRDEKEIVSEQISVLSPFDYDFFIASVHCVNGQDPWFPQYFDGKTRAEGFAEYLKTILRTIGDFPQYCAVGHIDYPIKGCPYEDKLLRVSDAPDVLDALFRKVIADGKCIEVNTSVLKKLDGGLTDAAVLKRYSELGGEYVTLGSDSHTADGLAYRFADALELLQSCGIRRVARFERQKPVVMDICDILK